MLTLDLRPSRFDELAVVNSRGAGGHTRHAAQAFVEMPDPFRVHGGSAFAGHLHQVNAPARGVHFLSPEHIRRAGGETKSAVHALVDNLGGGRMVLVKRTCTGELFEIHQLGGDIGRHQIPPTNRPGFRMRLGSNCCFTADISACASPIAPQASNAGRF